MLLGSRTSRIFEKDVFSVVETGGLEEKIRVFLIGVEPATFWPQLFKSWIALSPGEITIQRKSVRETNCAIQWIEIYLVGGPGY